MVSRRTVLAALTVAAALAAAAALLPVLHGGGPGGEPVVVVETEGLLSLYRAVECPSAAHRYVVLAPGGDPHLAQLTPSQAMLVREADVVVVVPGSPAGSSAAEIAAERGAILIVITQLDLDWAYVDGVRIIHAPWYDPANASRILEALAEAEATLLPECRDTVMERLDNARSRLEDLAARGGILGGLPAVADLPFNVYVARWLGAGEVKLLKLSHEAEPPPSAKLEALKALQAGGVALVTVDLAGNPVSPAGEWLLGEALKAGAKTVRVPAPWLPLDVGDALTQVLRQLEEGGLEGATPQESLTNGSITVWSD